VDAIACKQNFGVSIAESASAVDAATAAAIFYSTILENATAADQFIVRLLWEVINDNQTPNWQNINDGQTPSWTTINDGASTTWNLISQ
jgi:hypothetical protein